MRNAETVLGIIRDRGRRGLPLERVYRLLFNRDLYLLAYGKIARNRGAMTPGATPETVDGMTPGEDRCHHRRRALRTVSMDAGPADVHPESQREAASARASRPGRTSCCRRCSGSSWTPTTTRSSPTTPTVSDRAVAATPPCARCTTRWPGTAWFIEVDVAQFFDRLDHEVLLDILAERIHDGRFLRLIAGAAHGRVPGELAVQRHAQRRAAGRDRQPRPRQRLPRPVGSVRRDDAAATLQPRGSTPIPTRRTNA